MIVTWGFPGGSDGKDDSHISTTENSEFCYSKWTVGFFPAPRIFCFLLVYLLIWNIWLLLKIISYLSEKCFIWAVFLQAFCPLYYLVMIARSSIIASSFLLLMKRSQKCISLQQSRQSQTRSVSSDAVPRTLFFPFHLSSAQLAFLLSLMPSGESPL